MAGGGEMGLNGIESGSTRKYLEKLRWCAAVEVGAMEMKSVEDIIKI